MAYPEKWLAQALEESGLDAFPLVVPEGRQPPFIVYSRTGTARERDLDGSVGSPVGTFSVEIYADSYLDAKSFADLVRAEVDNFSGSAAGVTIQWSSLTDESDGDPVFLDGRERPTFVILQTLEITWTE